MIREGSWRLLRFTFHVSFYIFMALICLPAAVGQSDIGKIEGQVIDKAEESATFSAVSSFTDSPGR